MIHVHFVYGFEKVVINGFRYDRVVLIFRMRDDEIADPCCRGHKFALKCRQCLKTTHQRVKNIPDALSLTRFRYFLISHLVATSTFRELT
jgi:thymidylate synthase